MELSQGAIYCTLNNVPMTASALQKSRLPFGIHLQPFADHQTVPVSADGPIVRCGVCRAYINPYVRIGEQRSWQCNLCNRFNELPAQFIYDYTNQQYYDLGSKIEMKSETVEYVASVEYMVRPPQPACYMFVFDCSKAATEIGYIPIMAAAIADSLDQMPGDARASIGFIAFDSNLHYFSFAGSQVVHNVSCDVSTEVTPCSTDGILANMSSKREMILDFLTQKLPTFPFDDGPTQVTDTRSALGPAIKSAMKILTPIGGKISVIQAQLPNHGRPDDGSILLPRDDPSNKKNMSFDKNGDYLTPLINPASDFYKSLALEGCEHQISVDLFNLSTSYADLASITPIVKFSAGTLYHYSNTTSERITTLVRFDQDFRYHLVRPIGLESVLRLRYSRGLKIHTFHGNFFVRSPNLLVLPNSNPDASYAFQIAIEDDLKPDTRFVYFQASILYTTPEGERRIRVHTARYPTVTTLPEVIYGANQIAIVAMLAKMAVDRSMQTSIGEAKEALIGAGVDLLETYSIADEMRARSYPMGLPENLRLVPLYILALLKHIALRMNSPIRLDDRSAALERFKTLLIDDLITYIYPDLYALHNIGTDKHDIWQTPMQLTAALIERNGAYLLDAYDVMIIYVCEYIDPSWCSDIFGVSDYSRIPEYQDMIPQDRSNTNPVSRPRDPSNFVGSSLSNCSSQVKHSLTVTSQLLTASAISETPLVKLPELDNARSNNLRNFIDMILDDRPHKPKFFVIKENSRSRTIFTQYLHDDRSENYHTLHKILPNKVDPLVSLMMVEKVPDSTYEMVGGLDKQIKEIKEVIELPVKHPEIFEALGIAQPKGVLLYGPPGTGKTLLARAVAHHTDCTFIRVSGSELVQKFIGEGSRMVRELFVMAREHAPSIIFMDEIDSIGSSRIESNSGGDSEVQRTMLELLNQLDGFEATKNIKVIMATNRIDILDPALLRPGRIDRKIEFPPPNEEARAEILRIHSRKMNLTRGIDLKKIAEMMPGASGAEVKGVCTEAGMYALRERRVHVTQEDFEMAVAKVMQKDAEKNMSIKKLWK